MHGLLVTVGLLLLSAASFTLALPILDFTGMFSRLFPDYQPTPELAVRLAIAGVACLVVAWLIYLKRNGT